MICYLFTWMWMETFQKHFNLKEIITVPRRASSFIFEFIQIRKRQEKRQETRYYSDSDSFSESHIFIFNLGFSIIGNVMF